jgi:hypothetical protein
MTEKVITIDGIRVYVDMLARIEHSCDPKLCGRQGNCCSCYQIPLTKAELSRAIGLSSHAANYQPDLLDEDVELFEEMDDDSLILGSTDTGRCVFAFPRGRGMYCSLHAACLELDLPPYRTKPAPCTLWPLCLSESKPLELAVMGDAKQFPCNRLLKKPRKTLHAGIAEILDELYGPDFTEKVNKHL